jgi:hypothetical protein
MALYGINVEGWLDMSFMRQAKAVVTDSHFLAPFTVLIAGIVLLIVLH